MKISLFWNVKFIDFSEISEERAASILKEEHKIQ